MSGGAVHGAAGRRRALLAGGGSGGHVFPALAIAEELRGRDWDVDFSGAAGGMEARLVGERGWPFHPLAARPLVGRGVAQQVDALITLARSTWAARRLARRLGAEVVVGTGGYVSAPAVLGAALAGVPVLLVEPNAVPGVANRWLSRFAEEAAIAFPEAARQLACRSTVTGVPVRGELARLPAPPEGEGVALLVTGGSQGARQLNELVPAALGRLAAEGDLPPLAVLHQAGAGKAEATREAYRAAGLTVDGGGQGGEGGAEAAEADAGRRGAGEAERAGGGGATAAAAASASASGAAPPAADGPPPPPATPPAVRVVEFLADMPAAVGAAHLVVSRAGAITTAELLAAGRPAVLVPLLGLAGGHQLDNARAVADAGAAVVLPAPDLDADRLAAALAEILADRPRLARMAERARAAGRPDAAGAIADRVEALAAGRVGR